MPQLPDDLEHLLPLELRRELLLSTDLRRSFVSRVLAGLPREECARLLHRDVRRVDQCMCAAAQELALELACLSQDGYWRQASARTTPGRAVTSIRNSVCNRGAAILGGHARIRAGILDA